MQEIDDFFDQLDPNIDVIWGTSTDDSLGEDAKVTILATGLEDDLKAEMGENVYNQDDALYEDLIPRLYKPKKIKSPKEVIMQELPFEVEPAKEPVPAVTTAPEPETEEVDEERELTTLDRLKIWLNAFMKDVTE